MALNWGINDCANVEQLKTDAEWPITEAIIWSSMAVGIGELSEKTLAEWALRLRIWETNVGPLADRFITKEDLRKRIGLKTNVFPKETMGRFRRKVFAALETEARHSLDREAQPRG